MVTNARSAMLEREPIEISSDELELVAGGLKAQWMDEPPPPPPASS